MIVTSKKNNNKKNLFTAKVTAIINFVNHFLKSSTEYAYKHQINVFLTSDKPIQYNLWSYQKVLDAFLYLLDDIFVRLGSILYILIVNIRVIGNCAPLVADLCFFLL